MATQSTLKTIIFRPTQVAGASGNANNTIYSWPVPDDWNPANNIVHAFGGGGSAGRGTDAFGGTGGGGGAYANTSNLYVKVASEYTNTFGAPGFIYFYIGAGGSAVTLTSTAGNNGGNTWVANVATEALLTSFYRGAKANGGAGGSVATAGAAGGAGGTAAASIGRNTTAGGAGGTANNAANYQGGAGGGSAGSLAGVGTVGGTSQDGVGSGGGGGGGLGGAGANSTSATGAAGGAAGSFGGGGGSGGAGATGLATDGSAGLTGTRFTDTLGAFTAGAGGGGGGGGGGSGAAAGQGGNGGIGIYGSGGGAAGGGRNTRAFYSGPGGDGLVVIQYTPTYLYSNLVVARTGSGTGPSGSVNTNSYFPNNAGNTSAKIKVWWANTSTLRNQANTTGNAITAKVRSWTANTNTLGNKVVTDGTVSGPSSKLSAFVRNYNAANSQIGNSVSTESYYRFGNKPYARAWVANTKATYTAVDVSGAAVTSLNNQREWTVNDIIKNQAPGQRHLRLTGTVSLIQKEFNIPALFDLDPQEKSISGGLTLSSGINYTTNKPYYYFSNIFEYTPEIYSYVATSGFKTADIDGIYSKTRTSKVSISSGVTTDSTIAPISVEFDYMNKDSFVCVDGRADVIKEKIAPISYEPVVVTSGYNYTKNEEFYNRSYTYLYNNIIGNINIQSSISDYYKIFDIKPRLAPKSISGNVITKGAVSSSKISGAPYKFITLNEDSGSNNWISTTAATTNLYTYIDDTNANNEYGIITYVPSANVTFRLNIPRVARKDGWAWRFKANTAYDQPIILTTKLISDNTVISSANVTLKNAYEMYTYELTIDEIYRIVDGKTLYMSFELEDIPAYSNTTPTVLGKITSVAVRRINKERRSVVG